MSDCQLGVFGDLGERRAVRRVIEDRVVAESGSASRLTGNLTFDDAAGLVDDVIAIGDGQRAYEARCAVLLQWPRETAENLSEAFRVGRIGSKEPGRTNTRLAVQAIDHQSRILRDRRHAGMVGVVEGFEPGVVFE